MIKVLARSIREFKKASILTPLLVTVEVILECAIPFVIANLVNQMQAGCSMDVIVRYGIVLIAMSIVSLIFGGAAGATCAAASTGFARNLRRDMFYNIQNYSFENIDKFSVSSLVTRMTTDIMNVQMAYMMIIRVAIRCPLMLVFSFAMGFIMGGRLAIIFLFTIPILSIGLFLVIRAATPLFRRVFRKYDALNDSVQENVQAMRVVKSYVREEYEKKKFGAAAENVQKDFTKAERIMAINSPMMQFCVYAGMVFVISYGSYAVITSRGLDLNVGQMSAMLTYSFQILMSLMMVSMVLSEKSSLTSPENGLTEVKDGSIDFDNVSFKYSKKAERMALADIDLHIKSGEVIGILGGTGSSKSTLIQLIPRLYDGILGGTGSSKSTLIQLIPRLYDVTEGSVKVGGEDVRKYDLEALRNQVSVVLQKNVLFSGTIKDNLRWGNPDATDEQLIEACKLAQADEFIQQFPDKYDTWIEQGGSNVSGGQKQRLCIARALLKKPKILILDDSTSAVDTKTDALIRKGFREFIPETTKIIIAQRVASVQDADRIILMKGGRIDAIGSHDELMKSSEVYREIYTSQNRVGGEKNE